MANVENESPAPTYLYRILLFLRLFWKTGVTVLVPIILLPIMLLNYTAPYKCLYVVVILAIFWITEAIPLPVTSIIPIVAFPVLDIMATEEVCMQYFKGAVVLLWAGLVVALAIEHSNLHKRIALRTILWVGCSLRRLMVGFTVVTIFMSMWLANTAAAVMMCPIIMAVLEELQEQNLCKIYEDPDPNEGPDQVRRPSRVTIAFYCSVAFAASIGGIGTLIGSGTNLTTKGVFETRFPDGPGIDFTVWMIYGIPVAVIAGIFTCFWLQFIFMGLLRPKSLDAQNINIGKEGEMIARDVILGRFSALGPMTLHELLVAIVLFLLVALCFTRKPQIFTGWAELLTDKKVSDSTPGIFTVLLCFTLPSTCLIQKFFMKGEELPKEEASPLIPWSVVQQKLPWGLIYLLGGGFAVSKAGTESGMAKMIGGSLSGLKSLPLWGMSAIMVSMGECLTEFASNVAISNVILPIVLESAIATDTNPLYFVYPVGICCSFAMLTPVATPPNTIIVGYINLRTRDLIIAGIGPKIVSIIVLVTLTPLLGKIAYPDIGTVPDWAKSNATG